MDHITQVLRSLHWPQVCQRADFKILLFVLFLYKALNGLGPKYKDPPDTLVCRYYCSILAYRRYIGISVYVLQYVPILQAFL